MDCSGCLDTYFIRQSTILVMLMCTFKMWGLCVYDVTGQLNSMSQTICHRHWKRQSLWQVSRNYGDHKKVVDKAFFESEKFLQLSPVCEDVSQDIGEDSEQDFCEGDVRRSNIGEEAGEDADQDVLEEDIRRKGIGVDVRRDVVEKIHTFREVPGSELDVRKDVSGNTDGEEIRTHN